LPYKEVKEGRGPMFVAVTEGRKTLEGGAVGEGPTGRRGVETEGLIPGRGDFDVGASSDSG